MADGQARRRPANAPTANRITRPAAQRSGQARRRSRDIVKRCWLDDDSKITLQELTDEYGVSAERIRQIEAHALKKKMQALFAA